MLSNSQCFFLISGRANSRASADLSPNDYMSIGHSAFAIGRFMSAAGCLVVKPRRILLFLFVGLIITSILCMKISGYNGVAMIILTMFFEVSNFLFIQSKQYHGSC